MVKRHNNQLPDNLPQLQNLIKRDPVSYKDEFLQQMQHYQSLISVFQLRPNQPNKQLYNLVMFMAQVAHCYPEQLVNFAQELITLLQTYNTVLDPDMRMIFCRALILLRNKNLLAPTDLLSLFFQLLKCKDKKLRKFLEMHIITDIKNINSKHKDARLNTTLQNFMYSMLKDNNEKAAKMSVDIMIQLYKKNVWNDAKTVNVIAAACFSKVTKVMATALTFFTSSDTVEKDSDDSDSDDEPNPREVSFANKVNKKTRKRDKQLKKVKQLAKKSLKNKGDAPTFNFSALHLIHDPQGLAEKLLRQLETTHERFEVRLMTLDVISRLIGLHQLILFNFYPYVQRFLQPHQKEVVRLLQFVAQSAHELLPPDALEPILRSIVNNFVTERNSSDCMAIGLNAVRELCARCPLVMTSDLLRDLAQYKNYREKSVSIAAKSLIHIYRTSMPELLHKRDRGKPTDASIEIKGKQFGEVDAKDYIPGAEILIKNKTKEQNSNSEDEDDDSDGEWIDVAHSSDEGNDSGEEEELVTDNDDEENADDSMDKTNEGSENLEESTLNETASTNVSTNETINNDDDDANKSDKSILKSNKEIVVEGRKTQAATISLDRIFTDDDFARIDAENVRKQVDGAKRGKKRSFPDEKLNNQSKGELVSLADIEMIHKKRKHDKLQRIQSIQKGREDREKFGYKDGRVDPHSSKTNREKKKTKNFMMIKHKARSKVKRSFRDKQIALRNYLLKQKRMR